MSSFIFYTSWDTLSASRSFTVEPLLVPLNNSSAALNLERPMQDSCILEHALCSAENISIWPKRHLLPYKPKQMHSPKNNILDINDETQVAHFLFPALCPASAVGFWSAVQSLACVIISAEPMLLLHLPSRLTFLFPSSFSLTILSNILWTLIQSVFPINTC